MRRANFFGWWADQSPPPRGEDPARSLTDLSQRQSLLDPPPDPFGALGLPKWVKQWWGEGYLCVHVESRRNGCLSGPQWYLEGGRGPVSNDE